MLIPQEAYTRLFARTENIMEEITQIGYIST